MPTIQWANFAFQQIDCAMFSGDLTFKNCELKQQVPGTLPAQIFLNTGNLTSLTCIDCGTINHEPTPLVTKVNCDESQIDYSTIKRLDIVLHDLAAAKARADLKDLWTTTRDAILAQPAISYADFIIWWNLNKAATNIIHAETFFPLLQTYMNTRFGINATWADFKTWVQNNYDAEDFEEVL
jgi:hypothetical protein